MEDLTDNLDKKSKAPDAAYYAVLSDFQKHCQNTISNHDPSPSSYLNGNGYTKLKKKFNLNSNEAPKTKLQNEISLLCSELCYWIYTPDKPIPKPFEFKNNDILKWQYTKIVQTKATQISQWAFLQFSNQSKDAFLVFKGTDPEKIFDIMADTAVIPMPIWCREDAKNTNAKMDQHQSLRLENSNNSEDINAEEEDDEWQFCGHSGMYATLMRDFHRIWKIINCRIALFDNLYVIGHSLGGGLATLFGLESIINKFIPKNKKMKIVTFGSPSVISYENEFDSLSQHAKKILYELHSICHCFVNRFDPIVRIPARIEWGMTAIPYALRKIIADQVKSKMNLPNIFSTIIKTGVKSGVAKFVQYVERHLDILRSYHPIGTFHFFAGKDCDEPFVTNNQSAIEELLGFIPPHKIVTSDGQEVRVSHYSTRNSISIDKGINGMHKPTHSRRFSLKTVTEVTLNKLDLEKSLGDDEDDVKKDIDKLNILDLLMQKSQNDENEGANVSNNSSALYVAVESDEKYRSKKLSEQGWVMLVSNHMMEEYVNLFRAKTQPKISQYPMLSPKNVENVNHFGVKSELNEKTEELGKAIHTSAKILKTTGKIVWNQAKQELQKKKMEFEQSKYPQVARINSDPKVTNNPLYQPQPPLQQYYVQQPPLYSVAQQQYYQPQYVQQQYVQPQQVMYQQPQTQTSQINQNQSGGGLYPCLSKNPK